MKGYREGADEGTLIFLFSVKSAEACFSSTSTHSLNQDFLNQCYRCTFLPPALGWVGGVFETWSRQMIVLKYMIILLVASSKLSAAYPRWLLFFLSDGNCQWKYFLWEGSICYSLSSCFLWACFHVVINMWSCRGGIWYPMEGLGIPWWEMSLPPALGGVGGVFETWIRQMVVLKYMITLLVASSKLSAAYLRWPFVFSPVWKLSFFYFLWEGTFAIRFLAAFFGRVSIAFLGCS